MNQYASKWRVFSSGLFLGLLSTTILAGDKKEVTFEMAFQRGKPEITQAQGRAGGWLDEEHYLWIEYGGEKSSYFKVNAKTGKLEPFEAGRSEGFHGPDIQSSPDKTHKAWVEEGDLFYEKNGEKRRLTRSFGQENNPRFSPNYQWLAYTRERNLYAMDLDRGLEYQLTNDGSDTIYNGYSSWVYFEEILGRSSRYCAFWWSPDNSKLLFMRFDDGPVERFSIYHETGNYGAMEVTRYPKSGEANPMVKMGVIEVASGSLTWLDFDESEDAYLAWPFWTPDSKSVHVQWMNRDQNHLIIYECDVADGSKKPVYEEKQDAWVEFFDDITYLKDGSGFILRSDKDGWRHLYLHNMDGSLKQRLTSGDWRVTGILSVDEKKGVVYFTGQKEDTAGSDLFSVNLDGSKFKTISKPGGTHRVSLSPNHKYYLDTWSDYKTPTQVNLHKINGKLERTLSNAHNPESDAFQMGKTEYFTIPSDNYDLPAYWVLPHNLDTSGEKKYGVIFRIYSGPNAPTVRNSYHWDWDDHYYASNGVITISVDHRASGHFGKKGVAQMHRNLGKWELHDLSNAVKWLREKPFIDPDRIGITGHSYGGYMTLLALSKGHEYFTHGVAGAPVTDWSLYDTVYTERYMDRPQDNPDGYKEGSVLTHGDKITGKLRLIHGSIDDNVHMQNSMQLIDILTNKNIQFELMIYPGSRHGIRQRQHRADGENIFWFKHFLNRSFEP